MSASRRIQRSLTAAVLLVALSSAVFAADQPAKHRNLAREERNRALVLDFYDRVFNKHDTSIIEKVMVEDYIQHNPNLPTGRAALISALPDYLAKHPEARWRFVRSAAEGDLVFLHIHQTNSPTDPGRAYVDIFRVVNGKIVEHWDVSQPVPEKSANNNTMF